MKRNRFSSGLVHAGALLAIILLAFVGCSNPTGSSSQLPKPSTQDVVKALLQELLGPDANIQNNTDGTYTISNFYGIIPYSGEDLPGDVLAARPDANHLDLNQLPMGESVPVTLMETDAFTITRRADGFYLDLPKGYSYVMKGLAGNYGSYTVGPTDRQYINNFFMALEDNLGSMNGNYSMGDDNTLGSLSLPYQDEAFELPLPSLSDFPANLAVDITINGAPVYTDSMALAEGDNSIVVTVSLNNEGPDSRTLVITMAAFVPISGISLSPEELTLFVGANPGDDTALIATDVQPVDATNQTLAWTSSDEEVASVDAEGHVTALKSGTAVITAAAVHPKNVDYKANSVTVAVGDLGLYNPRIEYSKPDGTPVPSKAFDASLNISVELGVSGARITFEKADETQAAFSVENGLSPLTSGDTWFDVSGFVLGDNKVTVTLSALGHEHTYTLTVTQVDTNAILVTGVTLNPLSQSLYVGGTASLQANVIPSTAKNLSVIWSSSNSNIASIDSAGNITGVSAGTATITVKTVDGGYTATQPVTVEAVPVTGIGFANNAITLPWGGTYALNPTFTPSGASIAVTWTSSAPSVASVSNTGLVTAGNANGTAVITAKTADGKYSATCGVTVTNVTTTVTGVTLDKKTLNLAVGGNGSIKASDTLTATVSPAGATIKTVTWSSDKPSVAVVDSNGNVTALGVGTASIKATTVDSTVKVTPPAATCTVTVSSVPVSSVSFTNTSMTLALGTNYTLIPVINPSNATNPAVTWTSDNESVVLVDKNSGVITGRTVGTATITATSVDGGRTAVCDVTVVEITVAVTGISAISPASVVLTVGDAPYPLTASVIPDTASVKTIIWNSNNPLVASVDQNGNVYALGEGTARISATTADGSFSRGRNVTVNPKNVPVEGVTLSRTSLTLAARDFETLFATINPTDATNQAVTWTSDKESVATVVDGTVTGVSEGTAVITVTTTDGGFRAKCDVTVTAEIIHVSSVTVTTPASSTINVGGTVALAANITPNNASQQAVTWKSSDSSIASVDSSGLVTGIKDGTVTIIATSVDGLLEGTRSITVNPVTVNSISFANKMITLYLDGTYTLTPTFDPVNAKNQEISWDSDKKSVATVADDGTVTAVGYGTATITATAKDTTNGVKLATCNVTVIPITTYVTGVTVSPASLMLAVGGNGSTPGSAPLAATVNPAGATIETVTWTSDNTNVAIVDASGTVTAVGVGGPVTVTATTADGNKTDTCAVTVNPVAINTVNLADKSITLLQGGTYKLIPTFVPANATNQTVSWTSDNGTVASVVGDGVVTANSTGTTTIRGNASGHTVSCGVTVKSITEAVPVQGISTISPATIPTLTVGDPAVALSASVLPNDASVKTIVWTSNDPTVASVDPSGKVYPVGVGNATITATADGGFLATRDVTVIAKNVPVTSVTLSRTSLTLAANDTKDLFASVNPSDATNQAVTWDSDKPSVATVVDGTVTGVSEGTAVITVTTVDGSKTATCTVTVTPEVIHVSGVTLDPINNVTVGGTATLKATVSPSNATTPAVTWSSLNSGIASVDSAGNITGVSVGTTTITVKTVDGAYTAEQSVTVEAVPVTGISFANDTITLPWGGTYTLHPVFTPSGASTAVTWDSSVPAVAGVSGGVVTAGNANGTTAITVTTADGKYTATCRVTVTNVTTTVTGVSLDKPTLNLAVGGNGSIKASDTLIATVSPAGATIKTVIWSSDNTGVAVVDSNGNVTAVGVGSAVVKAKTADTTAGDVAASCTVTVSPVSVDAVSFTNYSMTLALDASFALIPVISPSNATNQAVTWSSGDASVVAVDPASGVITGKALGTAVITVKSADGGKTATCVVTVVKITTAVIGISAISPAGPLTLTAEDTRTLSASVNPANASVQTIIWNSSNPFAASVDSNGVVTAVGAGTATITASTLDGGWYTTCTVKVIAKPVGVISVSLNKATLTLTEGDSETLFASVNPTDATNKKVSWSSSSANVATVDSSSGAVKAIAAGTATITATTEDGGKTATCTVTVTAQAAPGVNTTITFSWAQPGVLLTASTDSLTIYQGDTVTVSAPVTAGVTYQWYLDNKVVSGATGNVYVFNSAGKALGDYRISLWAGNNVGGDTIVITVVK